MYKFIFLFSAWFDCERKKFWSVDCEGGSKQCEQCRQFQRAALNRLKQFGDVRITEQPFSEYHVRV